EHQLAALARMAVTQQVELALTSGNLTALTAVEDWQATAIPADGAASVMQREQEDLLRARILIAQGAITGALHLLGNWKEQTQCSRYLLSDLETYLLLSLACAASAHPAEAEQALKEALILAQPEGFQRLFLDKGEAVATLLRTLYVDLRVEPLVSYARDLLLAFASQNADQPA